MPDIAAVGTIFNVFSVDQTRTRQQAGTLSFRIFLSDIYILLNLNVKSEADMNL